MKMYVTESQYFKIAYEYKKTFKEEYLEFLKQYEAEYNEKYLF